MAATGGDTDSTMLEVTEEQVAAARAEMEADLASRAVEVSDEPADAPHEPESEANPEASVYWQKVDFLTDVFEEARTGTTLPEITTQLVAQIRRQGTTPDRVQARTGIKADLLRAASRELRDELAKMPPAARKELATKFNAGTTDAVDDVWADVFLDIDSKIDPDSGYIRPTDRVGGATGGGLVEFAEADLPPEDVRRLEGAARLALAHAKYKWHRFAAGDANLEHAAQMLSDLTALQGNFDPIAVGLYEALDSLNWEQAATELDIKSHPNLKYDRDMPVRLASVGRVAKRFSEVKAQVLLRTHDVDLPA